MNLSGGLQPIQIVIGVRLLDLAGKPGVVDLLLPKTAVVLRIVPAS
jgi:hypothetical protein